MDKKSKYSQYDEVKNEKSVDTNETHLFAGIISFFFPAWGELFRGHYKNWFLYSFIGTPLVILLCQQRRYRPITVRFLPLRTPVVRST